MIYTDEKAQKITLQGTSSPATFFDPIQGELFINGKTDLDKG